LNRSAYQTGYVPDELSLGVFIVSIIVALTVCCQFDLGFNISVITKESAENPELAVGKSAYAVIKASNVMIGVD
jgi:molybdopterin-binding protein